MSDKKLEKIMRKYISALFLTMLGYSTAVLAAPTDVKTDTVSTPEKLLPAGVDVTEAVNPYTGEKGTARKGTVAATVSNIAILNQLLLAEPADSDNAKIDEFAEAIKKLLPSLRVVGMFDFFTVAEWLEHDELQPGRTLVAVYYLHQYPQEITADIKRQLKSIGDKVSTHQKIKTAIKNLPL